MDWMMLLKAFAVGGALCAVGQLLIDKTGLTPARILTAYVVAGVVLTAVGVYDPLVKFAGSGATVPLTGFGYMLANGAKEAVQTEGWFGVLKGPLSAAAPGITAAITLSVLCALIFKPRQK